MNSIKSALIVLCVAGVVLSSVNVTAAAQPEENPLEDLKLTDEQMEKLQTLTQEFTQKEMQLTEQMESTLAELAEDLVREDRFDTDKKAAESAKTFNTLVRKISTAYGDLFKNRVKYVLDAKDVLTREQRAQVLASLDNDVETPDLLVLTDDFDDLRKALGLDIEQSRKVLKYRTDMHIKDLKLQLDIDNAALDLEAEITKDQPDSDKVNTLVMGIADSAVKMLDNHVEHFLKAKDVLTVEQKKKAIQMLKEE